MFTIKSEESSQYTFLSLFSGAGGLDLGFEKAGFIHTESSDILEVAVNTLKQNRPNWTVFQQDVREYTPNVGNDIDVLLAGFPCQGFSLGGKREANDIRNYLYRHVIRIANQIKPRIIVMENVLNLRTMRHPETGKPFADQISSELGNIGYTTVYKSFRVAEYGVPQTRRRFIFIAYRDPKMSRFTFPKPTKETPIRDFIYDLGQDLSISLPNHNPIWGFKSYAHTETNAPFNDNDIAVPVRFSRTASEGNPIRDFNSPFPAVDTATVWGWALGNVIATRIQKDRNEALYVRNPESNAKLWRISASKLRPFTAREYARLQTFPDDWIFIGENKRDIQLQIGNAVPVIFAKKIALSVKEVLEFVDGKRNCISIAEQPSLFDFTDFL